MELSAEEVCLVQQYRRAQEAREDADQLRANGDFKASAGAGYLSLDRTLRLLQRIAGPEIKRVVTASLLGVEEDDPRIWDPEELNRAFAQVRKDLSLKDAGDVTRNRAREAVQKLLLMVNVLALDNFPAVCAGSLAAVSFGMSSGEAWIAQCPAGAGRRRVLSEGIAAHQGYVSLLYEAYYQAGFRPTTIEIAIQSVCAEADVEVATLKRYQTRRALTERCNEQQRQGAEDRSLGRPSRSLARHKPVIAGQLISTLKGIKPAAK